MDLAAEIGNSGLALSDGLTTNVKSSAGEVGDKTHFNATSQLELSKRYYCVYLRIAHPRNPVGRLPYCMKYSKVESGLASGWWYRVMSWIGL